MASNFMERLGVNKSYLFMKVLCGNLSVYLAIDNLGYFSRINTASTMG
jgi:hypothetical protein